MADKVEQFLGESRGAATARVLDRLRTYTELETPSRNEAHMRVLATVLAADLRLAGCTSEVIDAPGYGAHVVAQTGGAGEHIVILSHMDTVHPVGTLAKQPFRVTDSRVEGPGTYDMKAGIAIAVESLLLMQRRGTRPHRPLRFVITCDEEIGSHSGLQIIQQHVQGAHAVLVTEPCISGGAAKTSRKGVVTYQMTIEGKAAHAGTHPSDGVSAIVELAHQIQNIVALANFEQGTTLNVGVVTGGTASNVVPAHAFAEIDVRVTNAQETERVHKALLALRPHSPGARIIIEQTEKRPPLERSERVIALYQRVRGLAAGLDFDMPEGSSGGGSDGSFTAAMGLPTLDGLGPDGGGAHASNEHVLLADLPLRLALFTRILESL
ncbi:MAG TPA: M20/M25/M40 family metallo-hydrolase [Longimicrobiales bacterium]